MVAFLRLLAVAALVVLLAAGGGAAAPGGDAPAVSAYALDGQAGPSRISARARAAVTWLGGPTTAATGELVNVFVSDQLPTETPQKWADFLASLTHGAELARLTARIATLAEVHQLCGARALGCYFRDEMISLGEPLIDGSTSPEEVVRHEYGHHVAAHRTNPPWNAIDWGPKHWASAATICARVSRGEAFPGNEGRNYAQNPGEAWAETYRLMDERKQGITTATWSIIDPSFFPSEAALQAADRDVLQPWAEARKVVQRRVFGKGTKRVWWIRLQTPLDGELVLNAGLPANGRFDVALVASNRRTVIRRAQWTSQRMKRTAATICGPRTLFVRVTPNGGAGRVTVTATMP